MGYANFIALLLAVNLCGGLPLSWVKRTDSVREHLQTTVTKEKQRLLATNSIRSYDPVQQPSMPGISQKPKTNSAPAVEKSWGLTMLEGAVGIIDSIPFTNHRLVDTVAEIAEQVERNSSLVENKDGSISFNNSVKIPNPKEVVKMFAEGAEISLDPGASMIATAAKPVINSTEETVKDAGNWIDRMEIRLSEVIHIVLMVLLIIVAVFFTSLLCKVLLQLQQFANSAKKGIRHRANAIKAAKARQTKHADLEDI